MGNYIEPVLTEEQMAAYLDGMLSTDENNMVESLILSYPELQEIQDAMDSVDSTYIYDMDQEIPIECLADDFILPDIDGEYNHIGSEYEVGYDELDSDQDNPNDSELFQDEASDINHNESCIDCDFDDMSF